MGHRDTSRAHGWGPQPQNVPRPLLSPCPAALRARDTGAGGEILPEAPKAQPMPFPLLLCQREQKFWRNFEAPLRDAEPLLCLGTRNPPPVPTQQHRGARRQQKLRHELHGWGWAAPCGATRCRAVPPCDDTRCRAVPPGATWCHPAGPNASSDSASPWAHGQGQVALVGHETWAPAGTKIISGAACPHRANSLLPMLCPWEQSQHRQEGTVTSPALVPPRCLQCKLLCAHPGA